MNCKNRLVYRVIFKIFYITANDTLTSKLIVCSMGYIKWTKIFNSITIKQYTVCILTLAIRCFIEEFTSTIKLSIPEEIMILWSLTIDTEYFNFKSKKVRCLISLFTLNSTLLWLIFRINQIDFSSFVGTLDLFSYKTNSASSYLFFASSTHKFWTSKQNT